MDVQPLLSVLAVSYFANFQVLLSEDASQDSAFLMKGELLFGKKVFADSR